MSEWDFLWGLEGQELEDAMSTGATSWEWDMIEKREAERERENRKKQWEELKKLRDTKAITMQEFKHRKAEIFE